MKMSPEPLGLSCHVPAPNRAAELKHTSMTSFDLICRWDAVNQPGRTTGTQKMYPGSSTREPANMRPSMASGNGYSSPGLQPEGCALSQHPELLGLAIPRQRAKLVQGKGLSQATNGASIC